MINLFSIGSKYYLKSGTVMSSIYSIEGKNRWDWGKVQVALEDGDTVNIRPATEEELEWADNRLKECIKE